MVFAPAFKDRTRPVELSDDDDFVAWVASRVVPAGVSFRVVPTSEASVIPFDKTFRNAWEDTGVIVQVNMPKGRLIHMDRIRNVRDAELEKESGSRFRQPPEIEELFTPARKARLRELRDIPQTFDLEPFATPEELKAAWPTELPSK